MVKNSSRMVKTKFILGLKWLTIRVYRTFLNNYVLIVSLCLKIYINILEHKNLWLPWINSFLGLFWLFRGPLNSTFWWWIKSVFGQFLCKRKCRKSRDLVRRPVQLFFALVHWNHLTFALKSI